MIRPNRPWTEHEIWRAKRWKATGYSCQEIDRMLGRTVGSTNHKLHHADMAPVGEHHAPTVIGAMRATPEVLAERERRREALDRRDLTGQFCGDPPIGYSALDRRQQ
jgi:hypothetical protein